MKAMILAAGLGSRMRPLTDNTPKPLLTVSDIPLLEHHVARLAKSGVNELVINIAYLGEQIRAYVGDGSRWGVSVKYSVEDQPLETGGGVLKALPLLEQNESGNSPFIIVNGDVWTDFDFKRLLQLNLKSKYSAAHLIMVPTPEYREKGDFALHDGYLSNETSMLTYSGIGVYTPGLFKGVREKEFPLAPLLRRFADLGELSGELHQGEWDDIGTPERLYALRERIAL